MSTVASRALSKTNRKDLIKIKVDDVHTYKAECGACGGTNKSGYFKLAISSIAVSGTGTSAGETFKITAKVPNHHPSNDTKIVNDQEPATNVASVTADKSSYIFAVNHGVPGPSVFVDGDGTWDLLHVTVELNEDTPITNFVVTITYTITWTEIDLTTNAYTERTLVTSVSKDRKKHEGRIIRSTPSGQGYYRLQLKKLVTEVTNENEDFEDSVPLFSVYNVPSPSSYGVKYPIMQHPTGKGSSVTKTYNPKLAALIVAVNSDKPDGNMAVVPQNDAGTAADKVHGAEVCLEKKPEWPCDDDVTATLTYTFDFETVA